MSFAPDTSASKADALAKPEALLRVPVGLASPLWGLFAGAAVTGAAWWWMTRWTRPVNLEALFDAAARFEKTVEPEPAALAGPVTETAEAVVEATAEPVVEAGEVTPEAIVETAAEAAVVAEALIEEPTVAEPVGGESAPISPVVGALAPEATQPNLLAETPAEAAIDAAPVAPKAKRKPSEPKTA
jgi:hypothetical protein